MVDIATEQFHSHPKLTVPKVMEELHNHWRTVSATILLLLGRRSGAYNLCVSQLKNKQDTLKDSHHASNRLL